MVPQKKKFLFLLLWGGGRADVNQQKLAKKNQSLNLIRSHLIRTSLRINIKIAIIIIEITKNDYHNNNNSNNNNNNDNNNNDNNNNNNDNNNNNRSLFEIN